MAVPDTAQALIGTFAFGVLLAASSAAFVLFAWKHAAKTLRDGLRLALISFLALASAWAITGFITIVVNPRSRSSCQVSVVFSTLFDQLARFSVEQFLLWASRGDGAPEALQIGAQVFLLARLVLGLAYVGLIRPAFNPTCVPRASVPDLAVALIIVDAFVVVLLAVKAISSGASSSSLSTRTARQNKSVFLSIAGLAIWMGMSVTYLLGFEQVDFVFRSAIPAAGLLILILILTLFSGVMFAEHDASRPSTRDAPPSSRSIEAPPFNYADIKQDNQVNVTRFISRNADGTFPSISRPMADEPAATAFPAYPTQTYTGPIAELDTTTRSKSPWGRFFSSNDRSAAPKLSAGQLKISQPVVHDDPNDEHNPLRRIQTIDLATAMDQDRERRQMHAMISPDLIATRPAPSPPRPSTAGGGLSGGRSDLLIKKKPLRLTAPPGLLSPDSSDMPFPQDRLDVEPQAATSAVQLSPGVEAMRRRSPRQAESRPVTQKPTTTPNSAQMMTFRENVSDAPPLPPFKFSNTPQVPSRGLPSNPKGGPRVAPPWPVPPQQTTEVMLVTEIVYKNPEAVRSAFHKKAKSAPILPKSTGSVVHRPRPIPRNQEDRQVFPAETVYGRGHRRSLSSGSLVTGKSILWVNAGDPKTLPPLPETPMTADSVTFPSSAMANNSQRVSDRSLQSRRPSAAAQDRKSVIEDLRQAQERLRLRQMAADGVPRPSSQRMSVTTTKESIRTLDLFGFEEPQKVKEDDATTKESIRTLDLFGFEEPQKVKEDDAITIGPSTAGEVDGDNESWRRKTQSSGRGSAYTSRSQRKSSPVIPDFRHLTLSPSDSVPATANTTWEMPSAMHMPVSKHQAHSTYIVKDKPASPAHTIADGNPYEAVITVMLDDSIVDSAVEIIPTTDAYSQHDEDEPTPVQTPVPALESMMPVRFHRQVGDECPSFSTRKTAVLKKRVPPPPPLPLSMRTRPMIIQTAEPSPVESPEEAFRMIQQQLDNLDRPEGQIKDKQEHEIALLADLEAEMGLQEHRWQDLHNNMDRGSISTFASTPNAQSRPASSIARSSIQSSQGDLVGVYGALLQPGSANAQMLARGSSLANGLEYLRGANNKERLSQAEWYMQTSAQLSSKSGGTTLTKITMADIGSPSPPDTNESDFEIDLSDELALDSPVSINDFPMVPPACLMLWQPREPVQQFVSEQLWVAPAQIPQTPDLFAELAAVPVFVRTRRVFDEALFIDSSRLWVKPVAKKTVSAGMWQKAQPLIVRSAPVRPKTLPTRPLTVRPTRRPKRISQLADILESPKELPNKRGTLGFFQFPWGEQSEHPVVFQRPASRLTAMPGTMSTGTSPLSAILEARARQLAAQEQAMQDLAEQRNSTTSPSDDEFDENTLWEIANLLRVDQVPSRKSMFGSLDEYENEDDDDFNIDDYAAELLSDDGEDDSEEMSSVYSEDDELPDSFEIVSGSPVSVVSSVHSLSGNEPEPSLLWDNTSSLYRNSKGLGLDQPSKDQWSSYAQDASERPVFRHLNEPVAQIESASLWATSASQDHSTSQPPSLWMKALPALPEVTKFIETTPVKTTATAFLWTRSEVAEARQEFGLAQPEQDEWMTYVDTATRRTPVRRLTEQAKTIESSSLWSSIETKVKIQTEKSLLWSGATSETASTVKASSLWRLSKMMAAVQQAPAHGLAQPKETEWQPYTSNVDEQRPAFRQQAGELELLQSNSLWGLPEDQPLSEEPASFLWGQRIAAATTLSSVTAASLWTKAVAIEHKEASEWLFNPTSSGKDRKRTSREILSTLAARPAAIRRAPVAELQTTSLWARDTTQTSSEKPTYLLWGQASVAPTVAAAVVPVNPIEVLPFTNAALWSKAETVKQLQTPEGLFNPADNGKDRKRTSREIISISAVRAALVREEPLAQLQTSSLWAEDVAEKVHGGMWMTMKPSAAVIPELAVVSEVIVPVTPVASPTPIPKSSPATLWTEKIETSSTSSTGLWTQRRTNVASATSAEFEFAPVDLTRKSRAFTKEPLPTITSTELWSKPVSKPARGSTWLGFASAHRPASGYIAYTPLWSRSIQSSNKGSTATSPSAKRVTLVKTTPVAFELKTEEVIKPVWTRPASVARPTPVSRVQSFAEDDFFNHFSAPSRRQTLIQQEQITDVVGEEEEESLPPQLSNSTWLSSWGWKKSN